MHRLFSTAPTGISRSSNNRLRKYSHRRRRSSNSTSTSFYLPSIAITALVSVIFGFTSGITTAFGITSYDPKYSARSNNNNKNQNHRHTQTTLDILQPLTAIFIGQRPLLVGRTSLCEAQQSKEIMSDNVVDNNGSNPELVPYQNLLNPNEFTRMEIPTRGTTTTHAVFGALCKDDMIESYDVFRNNQIPSDLMVSESWSLQEGDTNHHHHLGHEITVVAIVKLGRSLDGHEGIVHGGILALLMDDVLGFGYEALDIPMAFTANLNINFIAPVDAGSKLLVTVVLTCREGRKLYWKAQISDIVDGKKHIFCEATSLYIIPRDASKL